MDASDSGAEKQSAMEGRVVTSFEDNGSGVNTILH